MTTQEGLRQASARTIGSSTLEHNGDLLAMFAAEATIPAGATFNEAFTAWLQDRLSSSQTDLPGLMAAFAAQQGAYNWSSVGTIAAQV